MAVIEELKEVHLRIQLHLIWNSIAIVHKIKDLLDYELLSIVSMYVISCI